MTNPAALSEQNSTQDHAIWFSLRQAIAKSSGFKRWQQEQGLDSSENLDTNVRRYLEETLETLAY